MKAMVLAAGLGLRMRPLTLLRAKPALPVLNRPLLHWTMETPRPGRGPGRRREPAPPAGDGDRRRSAPGDAGAAGPLLGRAGDPRHGRGAAGGARAVRGRAAPHRERRRALRHRPAAPPGRAPGLRRAGHAGAAAQPGPVRLLARRQRPVGADPLDRGPPAAGARRGHDVRERARPRPGAPRPAARGRLRQRARPLHPAAGRGGAPAGRAHAGRVVRFRPPLALPRRAAAAAAGPRPGPRARGREGAGRGDRPPPAVGGGERGARRGRGAGRAQRALGRGGRRGGRARRGRDRRDGRGRAGGGRGRRT